MNRTNVTYRPLGEFIEPIDERNKDLSIHNSLGISNDKYFQEPRQVADNPETHKIVRCGYFAYNRATTRNGEKISIALREGPDCTVSSAYQIFRVKDESKLDSRYLMMWFRRPEFDRYARYMSHGSAHEFFEYEQMCEVLIPLPPIEEQHRIVEQYNAVQQRIDIQTKLITKLQDTAQTLYKKTFVDGIDKDHLPDGWRMGTLGEICDITMGQSPDGETYNENGEGMIFYQGRTDFGFRSPSVRMYTTDPKRFAKKGDVLLSVRAPVGDLNIAPHDCCIGRGLASICEKHNCQSYIYYLLMSLSDVFNVSDGDGTIFGSITKDELYGIKVIVPDDDSVWKFDEQCTIIDKQIELHSKEIEKLTEIQTIKLSRMGR